VSLKSPKTAPTVPFARSFSQSALPLAPVVVATCVPACRYSSEKFALFACASSAWRSPPRKAET